MGLKDILVLLLGLIVLSATMYAFYWLMRKLPKGTGRVSTSRYTKLVDRIVLSQDKSIDFIQLGEHILVLGISSAGISLLDKIHKDELVELPIDAQPQFKDIFSNFLKQRPDKDNEGGL